MGHPFWRGLKQAANVADNFEGVPLKSCWFGQKWEISPWKSSKSEGRVFPDHENLSHFTGWFDDKFSRPLKEAENLIVIHHSQVFFSRWWVLCSNRFHVRPAQWGEDDSRFDEHMFQWVGKNTHRLYSAAAAVSFTKGWYSHYQNNSRFRRMISPYCEVPGI